MEVKIKAKVILYSCFLHHGVPVSQWWDVTKYIYSCSVLMCEFEGLIILILSYFIFPLHQILYISFQYFYLIIEVTFQVTVLYTLLDKNPSSMNSD